MGENICFQNISCSVYNKLVYQTDMHARYDTPMPYVGIYVAVASLICCVAMVGDMIHGFRHKKFWMPSKYFTINAASLTVLAIAVKLPMDLSMPMPTPVDTLAKYSGSVFICIAMANFIPSLGAMNDRSLFQNLVALGILVLTLSGNIVIQFITTLNVSFAISFGVFVLFVLCDFAILVFSSIVSSTLKKEIELKYHQLEELVVGGDDEQPERLFAFKKLRKFVNIYWVMAETGNPVFVMSHAVTSSAAALICAVSLFYFVFLLITRNVTSPFRFGAQSDYKWSICFVLVIQTIGIIAGSVAPILRSLFTILSFCSGNHVYNYRLTFKVDGYWTSRLKEWKRRPMALNLQGHTRRKVIQALRNYFYSFCIMIHVLIVVGSKILRFLSSLFLKLLLELFCCIRRWKKTILIKLKISSDSAGSESGSDPELEQLKNYALLLEGEVELPQFVFKDIRNTMNLVIERGVDQQPKNLLDFIVKQSCCFHGLTEFDSDEIISLHEEEPPRCWSLSLLNLASIAIAFPTITTKERARLMKTVGEGVTYTGLVEKGLDSRKILGNVGNAADILWNGVKLNEKWMDTDLKSDALKSKTNSREVIEYFGLISQTMVNINRSSLTDDVTTWPPHAIVENSMYRISKSLLLLQQDGRYPNDLERIMSMIAEILVACLSNLPTLIITMCRSCSIEKMATSVNEAAHLLGSTKALIEFIQRQQLPNVAPENAPYMDKWRV